MCVWEKGGRQAFQSYSIGKATRPNEIRAPYLHLVAYKHDGHAVVGVLPGIVQPCGEMIECFSPGELKS